MFAESLIRISDSAFGTSDTRDLAFVLFHANLSVSLKGAGPDALRPGPVPEPNKEEVASVCVASFWAGLKWFLVPAAQSLPLCLHAVPKEGLRSQAVFDEIRMTYIKELGKAIVKREENTSQNWQRFYQLTKLLDSMQEVGRRHRPPQAASHPHAVLM